jgi:hypothetical protein
MLYLVRHRCHRLHCIGTRQMVKLLLGAELETKDVVFSRTPLSWAVRLKAAGPTTTPLRNYYHPPPQPK